REDYGNCRARYYVCSSNRSDAVGYYCGILRLEIFIYLRYAVYGFFNPLCFEIPCKYYRKNKAENRLDFTCVFNNRSRGNDIRLQPCRRKCRRLYDTVCLYSYYYRTHRYPALCPPSV